VAERLGVPLFRAGIPIFDRLGAAHAVHVGYRGTMTLLFDLANMFLASHDADHHHHNQTPAQETASHACENLATC
jgi:nitrogenase molybdenum-iron protein NifN